MWLRHFLLLAAAGVIVAAVEYRLRLESQRSNSRPVAVTSPHLAMSPVFEGRNAQQKFFRLDRYLGRHAVFVVFYEKEKGAAGSLILNLRQLPASLAWR